LNLLSNAIKFTSSGEVTLKAECRTHGEWSILRICVSDTGIGLSDEQKQNLFSPFSIGAIALNAKRAGGSGLGLALSHKIVSAMGGKLSVHSELGKGSEFCLELPCKLADAGKGKIALKQLSEGLPDTHLFILQRSQLAACAVREACDSWGLSSETISDEKQLLAKLIMLDESRHAIVLIDSVSCDFDELDVVRRIRALPQPCAQVPIILLTPLAVRGATERASEAGCSAFLTKPIRQEVLFNAILGVLRLDSNELESRIITRHSLLEAQPDQRPSVLLVEDNPVNQKVAVALLTKLGCRVDVAENGEAGLVALNQRSYDMVFMDLQMPVMDGLDATARIRNSERTHGRKRIPIVALTANAFPEDRERCFAVGMDDFIAKPVSSSALEGAIAKWLHHQASEQIRLA
ncbi:MAG TPA: response regulator, partial [Pseudomonadales bacterium]|nr:response regulator [Pseudomonadales bacterium]